MAVEILKTNPVEFHGYYEVEKYIGGMKLKGEISSFDYDNLMAGLSCFHNEDGERTIFRLVKKDGHIFADYAPPMSNSF